MSESSVTESVSSPTQTTARKGLTWLRFLVALLLILALSTAGAAWGSYRAGLAGEIPPLHLYVLILLAYPIAGAVLTAVNGKPSRWLRPVAVMLTFALYFSGYAHFSGFQTLYLRGLAERVRHVDLEPVKRWAAAHVPRDGHPGWISVDEREIPADVWQAIPLKGLYRPDFKFVSWSGEGDWLLRIAIMGGGFTWHSGIILTLGKDVDPSTVRVTPRALQVSPNVWVFDH